MQHFEYTVIPAPSRGEKVRGARTGVERFSYALLTEMNRMAANGWEYVRAETLPCEERSGLTSRTTVFHNVLVFRRALPAVQPQPPIMATHEPPSRPAAPRPAPVAAGDDAPQPAAAAPRPDSEPPPHWPDAAPTDRADARDAVPPAAASGAVTAAPPGAPTARDDRFDEPDLPAFVQRPPLAAPRGAARIGMASDPASPAGGSRLGPAER